MDPKKYSTVEVAERVGVSPDTLYRWMTARRFYVPPLVSVGRVRIRLWTDEEVEGVKKYKAIFYNKGRGHGRKKSSTESDRRSGRIKKR